MTATRGRRLLSDAEVEIWLQVARTVVPRAGAVLPERPDPPATKPQPVVVAPVPMKPKRQAAVMPAYAPPVQQPKPRHPPLAPFEKRYRQKVAHGRVEIEGAIDLHGLTQAEAHGALNGFLRGAQRAGARLVLVVTGKGRARATFATAAASEPGVLRRAVPHWLGEPALRSIVLGFEEASLPHGGMGALYVRLRKLADPLP